MRPVSAEAPPALVLGAAVWPGGVPSPTLRRRADHAARLWSEGRVSRLIGCGGAGRHPPAEALVMRDLWRAAGVPDSAIAVETASTTTLENLRFALPLLRNPAGPVVIVTDRYHACRARLIARHLGLHATTDCPDRGNTTRWRYLRSWLRDLVATVAFMLGRRR
ncbi:MAG: YdcF family protein [Gemmobacter sp.]|nr:YdcF family protein [Gemmobacter sp.]